MSITQAEARKVAHLARIAVADEALPALAAELNGILHFMEQLNEVDVEGVEPMTGVTPMRLKRRQDAVQFARQRGQGGVVDRDARQMGDLAGLILGDRHDVSFRWARVYSPRRAPARSASFPIATLPPPTETGTASSLQSC